MSDEPRWSTDVPTTHGCYYAAVPVDRRSWATSGPEVVFLFFDGKYSVGRPGVGWARVTDFSHWYGPLDLPNLPPDVPEDE
jgi:hypothetical protein